jgi:hypothetical protein
MLCVDGLPAAEREDGDASGQDSGSGQQNRRNGEEGAGFVRRGKDGQRNRQGGGQKSETGERDSDGGSAGDGQTCQPAAANQLDKRAKEQEEGQESGTTVRLTRTSYGPRTVEPAWPRMAVTMPASP